MGQLLNGQLPTRQLPTSQMPTSYCATYQWCRSWGCRGWKRTPKSFDLPKIRKKSLKIREKSQKNRAQMFLWDRLMKYVWIWLVWQKKAPDEIKWRFFVEATQITILWNPCHLCSVDSRDTHQAGFLTVTYLQKRKHFWGTKIFLASLRKFGQNSLALPNICLLLHLYN